MQRLNKVQVCVDLECFQSPVCMGYLHRRASGAGELLSFEYESSWLKRPEAFAFDPDLDLSVGPQYPARGRSGFGIFMDSSPDRWGRMLMQRRENIRARKHHLHAPKLTEWDFLLGVHDETRLGALRFREGPDAPFIDADQHLAAPPIASLRELQAASLRFEEHSDDEDHPEYERWLSQLFAPGTSLGGARPKACVRDETGALCMAKFPSRQDTRDVGGWELVASRLAARCGIKLADARPLRIPGSDHTTFLVKRFDRTAQGGRVAFVSAMTLTQRRDGEPGASYLELVDLLQSRGVDTKADCEQLFRRIVFSILIHNTDDHLRNHGFFIDERGIRLSPAYDINPSIDGRTLSLAINETETACDVAIAMDACQDYGLDKLSASRVIKEIQAVVADWRQEANHLRIPATEQRLMAPAFESSNASAPTQFSLRGFERPARCALSNELEQKIRRTPIYSLFFAIYPSRAVKLEIARRAARLRDEHGLAASLRKQENLHVTLHDMNVYKKWSIHDVALVAMEVAAEINAVSFDVEFDRMMSLGGGAVVLGGGDGVDELMVFRHLLGKSLQNAGLRPRRGFTPHMTLMYGKSVVVEQPVDPFRWRATEFALVNSHVGKSHHEILGRWPLKD